MAEVRNGNGGLEERNIIIIGGGTAGFAAGVLHLTGNAGAATHHRRRTRWTTLTDT